MYTVIMLSYCCNYKPVFQVLYPSSVVVVVIHMADGQFGTLGTAITRLNGNLLKQRKTGNWTQVFLSIPLRDELEITFQSQVYEMHSPT